MKRTNLITILMVFSLLFTMSCDKDNIMGPNTKPFNPQKVFKEFWNIYDRHYPLMYRKNINWQTVYDTYYPEITKETTDIQLFEYLKTIMTTVIKDGHCELVYNNQEAVYMPVFNENILQMVQENTPNKVNIVSNSAQNPYISYGTLVSNSDIGYINAKDFEPINENENEFNNFKAIVDEALLALKDKKGIIIDVRTNGGGQGSYAFYLAGRFFANSEPIELFRKRIKTTTGSTESSLGNWATEEFEGYPDPRVEGGYVAGVSPELNIVSKSGNFQYTNKVCLLTAKSTASAAEYFTVAMKSQSHVKTIGETTFGIFAGSDIFTLTNGNGKWRTRISTQDVEVKYNNVFQSFEGIGITPDEVIIPTNLQVINGDDVHITEAVKYINQ